MTRYVVNVKQILILMRKYSSIGKLLQDYRIHYNISKLDFSSVLNVDVRTLQRWENNQTLIKPDKEKEIVKNTLLPYQLVRNLNTTEPIATFYDFKIRKYSLSPLTNPLPKATWLKEDLHRISNRVKTIRNESDIDLILKDIKYHDHTPDLVSKNIIRKAIDILPELNLIVLDDNGFYAGHSIIIPITLETFRNLKERKINENEIRIVDIYLPHDKNNLIFYNYDITADCNDNFFYLAHHILNYFNNLQDIQYTFCSFTIRYDSYELNEEIGLELIWEDREMQRKRQLLAPPRFYVGDFKKFLTLA